MGGVLRWINLINLPQLHKLRLLTFPIPTAHCVWTHKNTSLLLCTIPAAIVLLEINILNLIYFFTRETNSVVGHPWKYITQVSLLPRFDPISSQQFSDLWLFQYINEIVEKILAHVKLCAVIHHCYRKKSYKYIFWFLPEMLLFCTKMSWASMADFLQCTASNTNTHLTLHNR